MERNLDEVMDSMEKMAKINDETREEAKESFKKLNEKIKNDIKYRDDIDVLFVNYNEMLEIPEENVKRVCNFLNLYDAAVNAMVGVIDTRLYRQRR